MLCVHLLVNKETCKIHRRDDPLTRFTWHYVTTALSKLSAVTGGAYSTRTDDKQLLTPARRIMCDATLASLQPMTVHDSRQQGSQTKDDLSSLSKLKKNRNVCFHVPLCDVRVYQALQGTRLFKAGFITQTLYIYAWMFLPAIIKIQSYVETYENVL